MKSVSMMIRAANPRGLTQKAKDTMACRAMYLDRRERGYPPWRARVYVHRIHWVGMWRVWAFSHTHGRAYAYLAPVVGRKR